MTANILDGRLVSDFLLSTVSREVETLKAQGITPKLVIILVGNNASSLSYIRQKENASKKIGLVYEQKNLPDTASTEEVISLIESLNADSSVHGILVQLPLPAHIEVPLVIRAIDPMKDVDGFQAYNLGKMFLAKEFEYLIPCTPRGIVKLLDYYELPIAGKEITIVGRSNTVGKPLAVMLINRDATVTVCHSKTPNLAEHTRRADILVVAVGRPQMVTADMVKKGAIVIDVGITKVENKLVGDVDFDAVKEKASWITPVPGGVGPMTVMCLMDNVLRAAKRLTSK